MERQGFGPNLAAASTRQASSVQPTTEVVNGTFEEFAANSPCFSRSAAPIGGFPKEF
jgi:hypothetical protein